MTLRAAVTSKPGCVRCRHSRPSTRHWPIYRPFVQAKLSLLPKHGSPGEGKEYAKALVAKAVKQKDVRLLGLAYSTCATRRRAKNSWLWP